MTTKTGWQCIEVTDLRTIGEEPGQCDRCERQDLRFLHTMYYPDTNKTMQVGCECAARLAFGYDPKREERRLRTLYNRRNRWLLKNWGTSWSGNETITFKDKRRQVRVTVFHDKDRAGRLRYVVDIDGQRYFSPENYCCPDDAKLGAFDSAAQLLDW